MKIVFFGTTRFSAYILDALLQNKDLYTVCAVVTRPDRPAGRSLQVRESEVKQFLKSYPHIPLYQPEKVSTPEFEALLKEHQPDLFVVVAFGEIIKQKILDLPPLGCFNIHASLLPKYRGAAPIQRAMMAGEDETGISIIRMVLKMDAGPIVLKKAVPIEDNDQFPDVEMKLMILGAECIKKTIELASKQAITEQVQDEQLVTFAHKIEPHDCVIQWNLPAQQVLNQIRALSPSPGAYTMAHIKGESKRVKILRARLLFNESNPVSGAVPGSLAKMNGEWCVATADFWISIDRLQMEGKPQMQSKDFFNGFKVDCFQTIDL